MFSVKSENLSFPPPHFNLTIVVVVVDFYYSDMPETYNLIANYKSVYKMTGRAIVGL